MQASPPTRSDGAFARADCFGEYPGVYRVGHRAPSTEARYLAAVLAAGQGAVLSGRAAAHLLGLVKGTPPPPELIARTERRIAGIKTHRSRVFDAREAASFKGIPVTTVPRTLVAWRPSSPSTHSLAPATRPESGMERRQPPSKACLGGGPTAPERESSAASSMETS